MIPEQGFCKTLHKSIIEYFEMKFPDCKRREILKPDHIGIGWNTTSYWFVIKESSKPRVSEDFLLSHLFNEGSWYEVNFDNSNLYYLKHIYKTASIPEIFEWELVTQTGVSSDILPNYSSEFDSKQSHRTIPQVEKVTNRFKPSPIRKRSLPEIN